MAQPTIDLFHPVCLPEMEAAALEVMRSGLIASGPKVSELEMAFADVVGREHVVSTSDLTSTVTLALHLTGVRAGDEVATIAFSCLQSNSPIARMGARPVWIDIDPTSMSMSVDDLAKRLTPSVKAVMVYHVAGYPADTVRIAALCRDRGIPLIEDCNNAIGATLDGCHVGAQGEYAVYSLYPNRQINGIDGGMLATPDAVTAAKAIRLRRFGIDAHSFRDSRGEINPDSDAPEIGWSAALSHLNASVALSQLNTLEQRSARTQAVAAALREGLRGLHHVRPVEALAGAVPAYWGFFVQSERRDALLAHLKANRVNCSIVHQRNDWYSGFGTPRQDLPGTAIVMDQALALPCGWWLTDTQVDHVLAKVAEFDAG
jgi:dTDP-4-amino-4,6-dideoxygalactose transaminase